MGHPFLCVEHAKGREAGADRGIGHPVIVSPPMADVVSAAGRGALILRPLQSRVNGLPISVVHKAHKFTPAMAGITDELWSVEDLVALVEASEPRRNICFFVPSTLVGRAFKKSKVRREAEEDWGRDKWR
jgi:hypothetical protein